MKSAKLLIDMAREKVHSDAELARLLGMTRMNLYEMKTGRRSISPETAAALCDVLQLPGDEAREWIAIAIIENPKNASRVELLKRALFACWAVGVAVLMQLPTDAQAKNESQWGRGSPIDDLYIVAHRVTTAFQGAVRRLRSLIAGARVRQLQPSAIAAAG